MRATPHTRPGPVPRAHASTKSTALTGRGPIRTLNRNGPNPGGRSEAKLGQALRHLPSGNQHANRVWLTAALTALNLTAFCCDLCPAARASGKPTSKDAPLRRAAKTLRRLLFCVPARIVRTGRQLILRLPAGFRHADTFNRTLEAVYALPP